MRASLTLFVAFVSIAGGCAKPLAPAEDTTPKNPTSVLQASFVINGMLLPETRGPQTVYTRGNMRRIDQDHHFEGWVARMFLSDSETSDIGRLDKNLIWHVDRKNKRYVECPIADCKTGFLDGLKASAPPEEKDDSLDKEAGCVMTTRENRFTVKATGQKRVVNGFDAEEYTVTWRIVLEDKMKRRDTNNVSIVFWTTRPTNNMREMWKVHEEFQREYVKRIKVAENPFGRFFANEVYMSLAAFSGDISKEDKQWAARANRELSRIQGYPVSTKLEWTRSGNACASEKAAKNKKSDQSLKGMVSGMMDGVLDAGKKQVKKQLDAMPIIIYVYEVKSAQMEQVHDSVFNIPSGAKLVNRL